jgi:hypothetical protein
LIANSADLCARRTCLLAHSTQQEGDTAMVKSHNQYTRFLNLWLCSFWHCKQCSRCSSSTASIFSEPLGNLVAERYLLLRHGDGMQMWCMYCTCVVGSAALRGMAYKYVKGLSVIVHIQIAR